MASGKKQYMISSAAYGLSMIARAGKFESISKKAAQDPAGPLLDAPARKKEIGEFLRSLGRMDKYLLDPELGPGVKSAVDPIRVFSNRIWSVNGAGADTKMSFLSGAMSQEADGKAHDSLPFDIVFSDHVIKTGDGVIPDPVEARMFKWRDGVSSVNSGLFPVYQENLKLLPIESAFNQYYLALTGLTPETIAKYDEVIKDPQHGEQARKKRIGTDFIRPGSTYIWNLMRGVIASRTRIGAGEAGTFEDYSTYVNAPFNRMEAKVMSFDGTAAHAWAASEYNFYAMLYEKFSKHCPELLLPCLMLQTAAETSLGDPTTLEMANNNISLGGAIKSATCGAVTGKKKKTDADPAEAMTISSAYWNEFGAVLSRVVQAYYTDKTTGTGTQTPPSDLDELANSRQSRQVLERILQMSPAAARAADAMRNLVFSGDYSEITKESQLQRENYPIHAEISFTADHFAQFSDHINGAGLMPTLIDSLIASEPGNSKLTQDIAGSKKPVLGVAKAIFEAQPRVTMAHRIDSGIVMGTRYSLQPYARTMLDVEKWIDAVLNNRQDTSEMTGRLHAHAATIAGKNMTNTLEQQIKTIIALGKIKDLVADYVRPYSQILKGQPAYSETVAYQVKKSVLQKDGGSGKQKAGQFIQNFWFANSSDVTNVSFSDTQVHYGKEYIYEIFAHTLVIGTKYDIGNSVLTVSPAVKSGAELITMVNNNDPRLQTMEWSDASYSQQAWYTPSLKIIKTRLHVESVAMYDSAPVVPEFEMVPYKGISHKLLLIFKGSVGRQSMHPIHITSSRKTYGVGFNKTEAEAVSLQRKYQRNEVLPGEPLLYESDDRPEFFEVFRCTVPPHGYKDFDGKLHARVSTLMPSENAALQLVPKHSDSATMVDFVAPNKKHYYTVRQIDVHGNFSNPTPVYEVELVDEKGTVFPIIKEYHFKDLVPRTNKKYFNKYIKIAPTVSQILINQEGMSSAFDATNGAVQLGVADVNLWGKEYKMRITSTTTGKAADLNIKFNQKHNKTITEQEGTDVVDKETGVVTSTKDVTAGAMTAKGHQGGGNAVRRTGPKTGK